ncbi:MAG: HD-GYP domain-containing protein [Planctomycetota bacterium]
MSKSRVADRAAYNAEFENTTALRARVQSSSGLASQAEALPAGPRLSRESLQRALAEVERRDATTVAHTWRVVLYTRALCEAAGMDHALIERACEGAALHDLGKLDVPLDILRKPGKLTKEEFALMREHPIFGHARLAADGVKDELIIAVVRHHHERIDGSGYPDGLAGEEIPTVARYFSVADCFDALTSVRPYRPEVGEEASERALAILRDGVGTQFCEESVFHFHELVRTGELSWVMQFFNRGEREIRLAIAELEREHGLTGAAERLEWESQHE